MCIVWSHTDTAAEEWNGVKNQSAYIYYGSYLQISGLSDFNFSIHIACLEWIRPSDFAEVDLSFILFAALSDGEDDLKTASEATVVLKSHTQLPT